MKHFTCDKTGERLEPGETTVLKVQGPLDLQIGRKELHLSKPAARELARWFGFPVADPLDLPGTVAGHDDDQADATAKDLQSALRVRSLANGTAAGSTPPTPKARGRRK